MDLLDPSSQSCGALFEWLDVVLEARPATARIVNC
jgi:hypothetical protein